MSNNKEYCCSLSVQLIFCFWNWLPQAKGTISIYKHRPEHLWNSWSILWELGALVLSSVFIQRKAFQTLVCLGNSEAGCVSKQECWDSLTLVDRVMVGFCLSSKHLQVMWWSVSLGRGGKKNCSKHTKTFLKAAVEWEMLTSLLGTRWWWGYPRVRLLLGLFLFVKHAYMAWMRTSTVSAYAKPVLLCFLMSVLSWPGVASFYGWGRNSSVYTI